MNYTDIECYKAIHICGNPLAPKEILFEEIAFISTHSLSVVLLLTCSWDQRPRTNKWCRFWAFNYSLAPDFSFVFLFYLWSCPVDAMLSQGCPSLDSHWRIIYSFAFLYFCCLILFYFFWCFHTFLCKEICLSFEQQYIKR